MNIIKDIILSVVLGRTTSWVGRKHLTLRNVLVVSYILLYKKCCPTCLHGVARSGGGCVQRSVLLPVHPAQHHGSASHALAPPTELLASCLS